MSLLAPAQDATDELTTQVVGDSKTRSTFGPRERSISELKGFRFMTDNTDGGAGTEVEKPEDADEELEEETDEAEEKETEQPNKQDDKSKSDQPEFPWEKGKIDEDAAEKLIRNLRSDKELKNRRISRLTTKNDDLADKLEEAEKKLKEYETAEETKRVEGEKASKKETAQKTLDERQVPKSVQALIFELAPEKWDAAIKDAVKEFGKTGERGSRPLGSGHKGDKENSPEAIRARRYNR